VNGDVARSIVAAVDLFVEEAAFGDVLWSCDGTTAYVRADGPASVVTFTGCPGLPRTLTYQLVGVDLGELAGGPVSVPLRYAGTDTPDGVSETQVVKHDRLT